MRGPNGPLARESDPTLQRLPGSSRVVRLLTVTNGSYGRNLIGRMIAWSFSYVQND